MDGTQLNTFGSRNTAPTAMASQIKFLFPVIVNLFVKFSSRSISSETFFLSTNKKIVVRNIMAITQGKKLCSSVQKNGTPFKKPRNNGGSPIGVKEPPTLLTMKMKKTIWYGFTRSLFSLTNGRISNMEAPVVPITLAIIAPITSRIAFALGVDLRST